VLPVSYWFDPGDRGKPYSASIRFSGHRLGVMGKLGPGDRFDRLETVHNIVPGSGPVSVTVQIDRVNQGEWRVRAEPVLPRSNERLVRSYPPADREAGRDGRMVWPGNPPSSPASATIVRTRFPPFARLPGVVPGSWAALVGLGWVVGLVLQAILAIRAHLDGRAVVAISLAASLIGLLGSKLWYMAASRGKVRRRFIVEGMCIQGFVVGAVLTQIAGFVFLSMPVGTFLDATAPGLILGIATGRPGCFFAGCCSGRPTTSRWSLWSSDRRLGLRRVPTQLMESLVSLVIGLTALILILRFPPPIKGAVFVGAVAAFTLARQLLLPLRAEPRRSSIGRPLVAAGSAVALLGAALIWIPRS
jgi:phosphatidylglycerol:prolipoprotein diacylglycerol transferase